MVANGDMNVIDPTTITIGGVAAAEDDGTMDDSTAITDHTSTDTNNKTLKITGDSSSQYPKVKWLDGSNMGMVAGRTYYIEAYVYLPSANPNIDRVQLAVLYNGGGSSDTDTVTATDAWTKVNKTIVDDDIQDIRILGYEDGASAKDLTGDVFYIDSLSVKEVGTATGWTDADQQLDIPQTALQSYNQLMFFQGQEGSTADRVLINPTTSIFNQSVGDYNSISSWVWFGNDFSTDTTSGMPWAVTGSKPNFFYTISGSNINIGYNTGNGDVVGVTLPHSTFTGKWTHFVMNWRISTSSEVPNDSDLTNPSYVAYIPEFFINGEKQSLSYVSGVNSNSCPTSGTADVHIGDNNNNYAHVGSVTELSIWTKKLSQAEVKELYNDGKALDATLHSAADDDLTGYWRNNGLADWSNIVNPGTNDATIEQGTETMLQQAGVDASRDCQGFLMNRQKDTNALNLTTVNEDGDIGHDYVELKSILNDDVFSVSCWYSPRYLGQWQYFIDNREASDAGWILYVDTSNNIYFKIGDGTDTLILNTGADA